MLISTKKAKQPSSSFSIENFMLGCLDDKYSLNLSAWSGQKNSTNITWYQNFAALTSHQNVSSDREPSENPTSSDFKALKRLSKNKDIVIQKADKGNTVLILDKCSYISAIEEILNGNSKFSKLDIPAGKINHIVNLEKRITSELKLLKDKEIIDKSTYKSIKPVGSRPGILYGLGKIHKETRNGIPPFRPILLAIGTATYRLAKFLLKLIFIDWVNS